jgi:hypothetical protein
MAKRNEPATEAEEGLFSDVGEGSSPTLQDGDRPAQDSAEEGEDEKTAFEPNLAQIPEKEIEATRQARRLRRLRAFIDAGRKMVMRLIQGHPDTPTPGRPTEGRRSEPTGQQPR